MILKFFNALFGKKESTTEAVTVTETSSIHEEITDTVQARKELFEQSPIEEVVEKPKRTRTKKPAATVTSTKDVPTMKPARKPRAKKNASDAPSTEN
jgi:hypothetical protein